MSDSAPSAAAPTTDHDPEAIITLACPACDFALNMRRKHIGLEGKCISCSERIQAVEEDSGKVVVKWKQTEQAPEQATRVSHDVPAQKKSPVEVTSEAETSSPAPSTTPAISPPVDLTPITPAADTADTPIESKWGFPDRPETPVASTPTASSATIETKAPAHGFFDDLPSEVSRPASRDSDPPTSADGESSAPSEKANLTPPTFSGGDKLDATVALFASDRDDSSSVNVGWGTKVPNETHASISPFSTGSAEPDGGFAETLFREGADNKPTAERPVADNPITETPTEEKSSKSLFDDDGGGGFATSALFGSGPSNAGSYPSPAPVTKPTNEDGHELPPLTPEDEEEMAMTMLSLQNERSNRTMPGWQKFLKKLFRLFAACVILLGIGYGAYVFMPDEKAAEFKEKVIDWLEPGLVIFDYLPGKTGEKSKGFQQLDNLKGKVGDYYEENESQLEETYDSESGLDFDEGRSTEGADGAKGLQQLDRVKDEIGQYRDQSQEELNNTYEGESGLDFNEGRPPAPPVPPALR